MVKGSDGLNKGLLGESYDEQISIPNLDHAEIDLHAVEVGEVALIDLLGPLQVRLLALHVVLLQVVVHYAFFVQGPLELQLLPLIQPETLQ